MRWSGRLKECVKKVRHEATKPLEEPMSEIKTYRDLIAWQKAMTLAEQVYLMTREMPGDERFGLTAQMRRAAVSIPSNIAEGHARQSTSDYLRFLKIARGSVAELCTQMTLAVRLQLVPANPATAQLADEVDRILQGLIRSLAKFRTE